MIAPNFMGLKTYSDAVADAFDAVDSEAEKRGKEKEAEMNPGKRVRKQTAPYVFT
jgi:hypothetical protein